MELSSALRTNLSITASSFNGVLGVLEVLNQNLYGFEPSTNCTFEGGNMKLIQAPKGNVLQIQNQNLYGSDSCIDRLYGGGDKPQSATLFQNRITEVQESCSGSESNINYDEGRISNLSGRTRFSLNTRVRGQNLYGPRSSTENLYDNVRVGGQNLYGPGPNI